MVFSKVICSMALSFTAISLCAHSPSPKVVVVGAGMAGLTAAYRLQQQGLDVSVYEARGRVGGRILSVKINDCIVELGGKNITDGGRAENMMRLVQEFGLETTNTQVDLDPCYFNGNALIPINPLLRRCGFQPELLKAQLDALALHSPNMRGIIDGIISSEDPIYKYLSVAIASYEGGTFDQLSSYYVDTLFHLLFGGVAAAHPGTGDEHSHFNLLSLKEGNSLLMEKMAATLGEKLYLNRPLVAVEQAVDGAYMLTFQGGKQVQADILILAIPCSVYEGIAFAENVLPQERLNAINKIQYGTNAKIFVPFSQSLTSTNWLIDDHATSFFESSECMWRLYYTGDTSCFSETTISDAYRSQRPLMEKMFGQHCPPFVVPSYAKDESFVDYEGPVGYSWPNDPYAKGSYSYIAAGQETVLTSMEEVQGEMVRTLFAPIDQRLYFAGEHASILLEVAGTMEAACESGERAARMVAQAIYSPALRTSMKAD